jgi:hypothetical protein
MYWWLSADYNGASSFSVDVTDLDADASFAKVENSQNFIDLQKESAALKPGEPYADSESFKVGIVSLKGEGSPAALCSFGHQPVSCLAGPK